MQVLSRGMCDADDTSAAPQAEQMISAFSKQVRERYLRGSLACFVPGPEGAHQFCLLRP